MDAVGVNGAIFISAFSLCRYDASYAVEVQRAHPGRFALVKPVDPDDRAVDDVIADWKKTSGAVGIRIMMSRQSGREPNDPGLDRILRAAVVRLNFLAVLPRDRMKRPLGKLPREILSTLQTNLANHLISDQNPCAVEVNAG